MKTVIASKSVYVGDRLKNIAGKSTDSKPVNVANGSRYFEVDTGDEFIFDEESHEWNKISSGGGGGTQSTGFFINGAGFPGNVGVGTYDQSNFYAGTEILSNALCTADFQLITDYDPENLTYGQIITCNFGFGDGFSQSAIPYRLEVNPTDTADLYAYVEVAIDQSTKRTEIQPNDTSFYTRMMYRFSLNDQFTASEWAVTYFSVTYINSLDGYDDGTMARYTYEEGDVLNPDSLQVFAYNTQVANNTHGIKIDEEEIDVGTYNGKTAVIDTIHNLVFFGRDTTTWDIVDVAPFSAVGYINIGVAVYNPSLPVKMYPIVNGQIDDSMPLENITIDSPIPWFDSSYTIEIQQAQE